MNGVPKRDTQMMGTDMTSRDKVCTDSIDTTASGNDAGFRERSHDTGERTPRPPGLSVKQRRREKRKASWMAKKALAREKRREEREKRCSASQRVNAAQSRGSVKNSRLPDHLIDRTRLQWIRIANNFSPQRGFRDLNTFSVPAPAALLRP